MISLSFNTSSIGRSSLRWLACLAVALVLAGCGTTGDRLLGAVGLQRIPATPPAQPPIENITVLIPPAQPVEVVSYWQGRYQGTLPCPDCDGLLVTLTLFGDATYELRTEALGAGHVTARGGSFTFNADETRITLDANGQNRMFDILPGGALSMLDRNGHTVTGANADRFVLRKIR